jgi:hypothetical protein
MQRRGPKWDVVDEIRITDAQVAQQSLDSGISDSRGRIQLRENVVPDLKQTGAIGD